MRSIFSWFQSESAILGYNPDVRSIFFGQNCGPDRLPLYSLITFANVEEAPPISFPPSLPRSPSLTTTVCQGKVVQLTKEGEQTFSTFFPFPLFTELSSEMGKEERERERERVNYLHDRDRLPRNEC